MFQWMYWDITCKPLFGDKYDLAGHKDSTRQSTFESTFKGVLQMLRCAKYPPCTKVVEMLKVDKCQLKTSATESEKDSWNRTQCSGLSYCIVLGPVLLSSAQVRNHQANLLAPIKSTTWVDKTATNGRPLGLTSSRSDSSRPLLGLHSSCAQSLPHTPETNSSNQAWQYLHCPRFTISSTYRFNNSIQEFDEEPSPKDLYELERIILKNIAGELISSHFALLGYLEVPLWTIVFLGSQPICLPQHLCISDGLDAVCFPQVPNFDLWNTKIWTWPTPSTKAT